MYKKLILAPAKRRTGKTFNVSQSQSEIVKGSEKYSPVYQTRSQTRIQIEKPKWYTGIFRNAKEIRLSINDKSKSGCIQKTVEYLQSFGVLFPINSSARQVIVGSYRDCDIIVRCDEIGPDMVDAMMCLHSGSGKTFKRLKRDIEKSCQ